MTDKVQAPETALSYSSAKELQSCEQKYFHRKVNLTPVDSDYEESDATALGKAFHYVMENSKHDYYTDKLIAEGMSEFEVDPEEEGKLKRMSKAYVDYHAASGLKVINVELGIHTPEFTGWIDAIAVGPTGWWIIDLKTSAKWDERILATLAKDKQLNLYAYFKAHIESMLDIKVPFLGCRYRVITKTKEPKVIDVEVPAHVMDPEAAWKEHMESRERSLQLRAGEAPRKNFGACMNYNKPCAYWSQCHGAEYTKSAQLVKVHTMESIKDGEVL